MTTLDRRHFLSLLGATGAAAALPGRMGMPEGFTVATVANNRLTTRYETYGFRTVAPQNT